MPACLNANLSANLVDAGRTAPQHKAQHDSPALVHFGTVVLCAVAA